jgi:hypothetical protein
MEPTRSLLSVLFPLALTAASLAQAPIFQAASNNAPGPRFGAAFCAFGNGSMLLFGGDSGAGRLGDTWRYDIGSNTWTQISGPGPSARRWAAMTLHGATGTVILHGGQTATGTAGDTWAFAGGSWTQMVGVGPSARSNHVMAYDPVRQRSVLFGGLNLQDTWEWTGTSWIQRLLTAGPSWRNFAGMAYDERRNVMMVLGGATAGDGYSNQIWELGAGAWTLSPVTLPFGRWGASFAYDRSRGRTVMFGGLQQGPSGPQPRNDVFEWDGVTSTWTGRTVANAIQARYGSMLVYRSDSGVWLFGGSGFGPVYGDLQRYFILNGATYTQSGPGCGAPALVAGVDELPWLGEQFQRSAQFATPHLVLHEIGFASQDLDLAFLGMPGCRLGSTADVMGSLLATGAQQFVLNIPNSISLNGVELFEQLAVFTPGANPFGVLMSPTMRIRLSAK